MDPDIEMDLEQQLDRNFKVIGRKYADYLDCICTILEEKGVTAQKLNAYLLYLPASTKEDNDKSNFHLLSHIKAELRSATELTDIFVLLSSKYSFLDCDIFEMIRERYCPNEKREDLTYPVHLKEYIEKHKIDEFVRLNPKLINPKLKKLLNNQSKELIMKLNIKRGRNLDTLMKAKKDVANILGLKASALRFCGVKKGCVLVTLLLPASIADSIFKDNSVFTSEQEIKFRAAEVLWFECNGFKFDFREGKKNQSHDSTAGMSTLTLSKLCR